MFYRTSAVKYLFAGKWQLLSETLRNYLLIFSKPRYQTKELIADGSPLLDCLAYGLGKLTEEISCAEDIQLSEEQMNTLREFESRLSQVAFSSKHWTSVQEWESVHRFAWELVVLLGWNDSDSPNT